MALSAPGIGSGLDIKGIVSQLVALESKPLEKLKTQASSLQTRFSAFGQLKSQIANLRDQIARLASPSNWNALSLSSGNNSAVSGTVSATGQAAPSVFSVEVSQLARAQSTASSVMPENSKPGSGTLRISLGSWDHSDPDSAPTFTPRTGSSPVEVNIASGDSLSVIANKINAAKPGVMATVLKDAQGERLLFRSDQTGETHGFRIEVANLGGGSTLGSLAYDPATSTDGMELTQSAQNTLATINGVSVVSTDNTFRNTVPGVTLNVAALTTGPVSVTIALNKANMSSMVSNFVESFNAISRGLSEMTKFDPATRTAGSLQGDATAVGLQNALRRVIGDLGPAGTEFRRLSDIGVEFQLDGTLSVNSSKLNAALEKPDELKAFFTTSASSGVPGVAVRIRDFADGLLGSSGSLTYRHNALQSALERNNKEQTRVEERVQRTEARLLAQYTRLDTNLASLNALSSYVAQQVTAWNNVKVER